MPPTTTRPRRIVENLIWDVGLLAYVPMQQPILEAGTVIIGSSGLATETTLSLIGVNTTKLSLIVASGVASASGNTTVVTPSAGKKIRLSYLSYNPVSAVGCAYRFGAAGALFFRNTVPATSVVAKDFGDMRYVEGGIDAVLVLNLSAAVDTVWNAFYIEV